MTVAGELCVIGQFLLRSTRMIIPSKLQPRTLALANEATSAWLAPNRTLTSKRLRTDFYTFANWPETFAKRPVSSDA